MGCDISGSNFNNLVFLDGKWWSAPGWDFSISAADIDVIIEKIKSMRKNPRKDYNFRYNWKQHRWVATPVNPPQPW